MTTTPNVSALPPRPPRLPDHLAYVRRDEPSDPAATPAPPRLSQQMSLLVDIQKAYADGPLENAALYQRLVKSGTLPEASLAGTTAVGRDRVQHNCTKRAIRWYQQTLKRLGVLENTGQRGHWGLVRANKDALTQATPRTVLLGFSTRLGVALWGSCADVFSGLDEPISLCLTSPPYPLSRPRAYGNPTEREYVDWICGLLEPIVKNLVPGGSVVLNVSNDIFLTGSPARSLYRERLVLALHDRLGLQKMDEIIWHNPCKAPGPIQWASLNRSQLNVAWEPVYWFTNDPSKVRSDNRRVLEPHSDKHLAFVQSGGAKQRRVNGDGSQRLYPGAFSQPTPGRIPRNLMSVRHNCTDQATYRKYCQSIGVRHHGASMPLDLARKLVGLIAEPGGLVVDPCGGSFTTAKAAQELGYRWLSTEIMREYVVGGASRFTEFDGYAACF
jgi:DNA modification methylase